MVNLLSTALGLVAAALIYVELAGVKVPYLPEGFRAGFIILALIGFAMCIFGGRIAAADGSTNWTDPYIMTGAIIGTLLLLSLLSMIFFKKVPFVSDKTAFIVLAIFILSKYLINILRFVTR